MPDESAQWYTHITESVEELRSELRSMQEINSTPIEFGLKVRSHPDTLLITAKNKAGRGKEITVKTTLSKKLVETYELTKSSQSINLLGAKDFLNRLETATQGQCEVNQDHFLYREIPVAEVLSFISAFKNDAIPITSASSSRLIIDYIRENGDLLDKWDVAIPQIKSNPVSGVLVHGSEVRPQKRKFKEKASNRFALSDKHRVASRGIEKIGLSAKQIETAQSSYRAELSRAGETYDPAKLNYPDRIYRIANRRPLLMLHFIVSKEEAPTSEIYAAWGLSFPDLGTHDKTIKYVVNTTYLRELIAQGESDDDDLEGLDDE
jgi:hypothetical protein